MTLTFGAGTVFAAELPTENAEAQVMDMETGEGYETTEKAVNLKGDPRAQGTVYSVTVNFDANGGKGAMASQTVSSNGAASLSTNAFTRKDYTFTGWNTEANGMGTAYADGDNVTGLATEADNGTTSTEIIDFVPNKKYYVRIRSYDGKQYSDWSNVLSKKTKNGKTLENVKCSTGIEADVTLTGSGSGYHAKLVLVTPTSAVSYGIQFDKHAVAPYTNKAVTLIENVKSNAPGQQEYKRPSGKNLKLGKKKHYHLMITIDKKGNGKVLLDYKQIGKFTNKNLANTAVYPRVEASVRLTGDKVNAVFDNVKLTRAGKGVGIKGDWDSDYENASGIWSF